jgi:hypothetical protein
LFLALEFKDLYEIRDNFFETACDPETIDQFPMNRHSLGTTGIEIFPMILGCGTFGGIGAQRHSSAAGSIEKQLLRR